MIATLQSRRVRSESCTGEKGAIRRLTPADPGDLGCLAAPYGTVVIEPLARKRAEKG